MPRRLVQFFGPTGLEMACPLEVVRRDLGSRQLTGGWLSTCARRKFATRLPSAGDGGAVFVRAGLPLDRMRTRCIGLSVGVACCGC